LETRGGSSSSRAGSRPPAERLSPLPRPEHHEKQAEERISPDPEAANAERRRQQLLEAARPRQQPVPAPQVSARQQAVAWFQSFLAEAESEYVAAEVAKETRAAAPARCLREDLEEERHAWDERTKKLKIFNEIGHAELMENARGISHIVETDQDFVSETEKMILAYKSSRAAGSKDEQVLDAETCSDDAHVLMPEAADPEEPSQIAAALLQAGLEPGLDVAKALARAASHSRVEPIALDPITEGDDCQVEADEDASGGDGAAASDAPEALEAPAQWATPAKQWAAERLRKRREKALNKVGTPCGTLK